MVTGATLLIAVGHGQRVGECHRMWPRQDGEGSEALGITIGDQPGEAGPPVVTDQMKVAVAMAGRLGDVERVADQVVDAVIVEIGRVGPGADRVAALVGRHGEIPGRRQRRHLGCPEMPRHAVTVQHQDERCAFLAGNGGIEDQARRRFDIAHFHPRSLHWSCRQSFLEG